MAELGYKQVNYVDSVTLDAFVEEVYGKPYRTQRFGIYGEPCSQETAIEFTLNPEDSDEIHWQWDKETGSMIEGYSDLFVAWSRGDPPPENHSNGMPDVREVMWDLWYQELIPGGEWIVKVWW